MVPVYSGSDLQSVSADLDLLDLLLELRLEESYRVHVRVLFVVVRMLQHCAETGSVNLCLLEVQTMEAASDDSKKTE